MTLKKPYKNLIILKSIVSMKKRLDKALKVIQILQQIAGLSISLQELFFKKI